MSAQPVEGILAFLREPLVRGDLRELGSRLRQVIRSNSQAVSSQVKAAEDHHRAVNDFVRMMRD